ncbi:c-type cytochrome [Aliikangiella marina]|uniref:c-type cytochrome n=1 Tax=Aliikangiella marina TaxID=1712262 RepID=UPI00163DAA8B|nr:cytochrome c [Aliikangiella marina]
MKQLFKKWNGLVYLFAFSIFGIQGFHVSAEEVLTIERKKALIELLKKDCGSCHGKWLRGNVGPPLLPGKLRNKSRDFLIKKITEGVEGSEMPAWKNNLSKAEIAFLVDYLTISRNIAQKSAQIIINDTLASR